MSTIIQHVPRKVFLLAILVCILLGFHRFSENNKSEKDRSVETPDSPAAAAPIKLVAVSLPNASDSTVGDPAKGRVFPKYDFKGALQDDPQLIEYIRRELLHPPSPYPYNLRNPKFVDYSQFHQSKYADTKFLHGMKGGFFVEVGALDGEYLSNSLYFEKELGWRGLLVEPVPNTYKILRGRHRNAHTANVALAITNKTSEVTFEPSRDLGELSHFSATGGITVKAIPLFSLLLALDVQVVDFFSLDIEAYEVKVLKTIPWNKVKFRLMCIEVNHIPEGVPYLTKYLTGKGYRSLGVIGIDAWFGWPELLDQTVKT